MLLTEIGFDYRCNEIICFRNYGAYKMEYVMKKEPGHTGFKLLYRVNNFGELLNCEKIL